MSLKSVFGMELPVIQAPMAGAQGSALAIAACNAGGLGSLPCAMLGPEAMRAEIARIKAGTAQPYNLNFFCHAMPGPDPVREAKWRGLLEPYYRELGIARGPAGDPPARMPFNAETAELLAEFEPPVVSFHFGLPEAGLLQRLRRWGCRILSSATTVEEALWLQAHGVDAVIAQGLEAGGHRGHFLSGDLSLQSGTFALLPQIVDAVSVPVIAAGGIADHRGAAAARELGAAGVQAGTAYLLCPEATTSAVHRAALHSVGARHTTLTRLFSGRPARHRQSAHPRTRCPQCVRACVSQRRRCAFTAAHAGRAKCQRRFFTPVVRSERCGVAASRRRRSHPPTGGGVPG